MRGGQFCCTLKGFEVQTSLPVLPLPPRHILATGNPEAIMEDRFAEVAALLMVAAMLISISCAGETGEPLPDPQAAPVTSPVPAPVATSAKAPTAILPATPFPTSTSTPAPIELPTSVSTSTSTPLPEPTAIPTLTPQPTSIPTAISKPTLPPRPTPTLSPTPTPAPTATPVPLGPYGSIQTGPEVVGMEAFDRLVADLMHRYNLPGGALAIVKDGRLVFARGYGLADIQNQDAPATVRPDSLFRIASLSKQVTAVAVLKLVEEGKLDLDERVFEIRQAVRTVHRLGAISLNRKASFPRSQDRRDHRAATVASMVLHHTPRRRVVG